MNNAEMEPVKIENKNTDIGDAELIFLGETHTEKSWKRAKEIIKGSMTNKDIFLLEGYPKGEKISLREKMRYGVPFSAKAEGYEKREDYFDRLALMTKEVGIINGSDKSGMTLEEFYEKYDSYASDCNRRRQEGLIRCIDEIKAKFPEKRIFISVGYLHMVVADSLSSRYKTKAIDVRAEDRWTEKEYERMIEQKTDPLWG